jgi:hypothetical protein
MILSLSGRISSGKDTAADWLVSKHGFIRESFAGTLKLAVSSVFSWSIDMIEGKTVEARIQREQVDTWWANRLNIPNLTPRWALQNIGTDVFRNHFHDDIWLASLEYKLQESKNKNIVISDSRFVNELNMLKSAGATTVMVNRGLPPDWWDIAKQAYYDPEAVKTMQMLNVHRSEWDAAGYTYDVDIDNNGSLLDLYSKVDELIG